MDKKTHINFWYVTGAVLLMLWIQSLYLESSKSMAIPYSRFQTLLNEDKVAEIGINAESNSRHAEGGATGRGQGFRHHAGRSRPCPKSGQARGRLHRGD